MTDKPNKLPKIFDKDPDLKKRLEEYLDTVPEEQKEADYKKFLQFVNGEITWAEIRGYPKRLLKEIAKLAYVKFRKGDFQKAEALFKGLSILDHNNWYYHAALGAVYQKQKLEEQAIDEYTMALNLNENEITSLTNRAECYLNLENYEEAAQDLDKAIALDKDENNPWGKRARALKDKIVKG